MLQDYPKYSDFENDSFLKGDKVTIEEILNKEIVITNIKKEKSKLQQGGTYNKIQIIDKFVDGQPHYAIFFSSSGILEKQINKYKDNLPFSATIIKQKNYYTLI